MTHLLHMILQTFFSLKQPSLKPSHSEWSATCPSWGCHRVWNKKNITRKMDNINYWDYKMIKSSLAILASQVASICISSELRPFTSHSWLRVDFPLVFTIWNHFSSWEKEEHKGELWLFLYAYPKLECSNVDPPSLTRFFFTFFSGIPRYYPLSCLA